MIKDERCEIERSRKKAKRIHSEEKRRRMKSRKDHKVEMIHK